MQGLVYLFVALAALGVGAAAYFGLTFTPIEAGVTAIAVAAMAIVLVERQLRRRAEARLEKTLEDLTRLLASDAQVGSVLSQRVNGFSELKIGERLNSAEADIGVLGDVVQQLADHLTALQAPTSATPALYGGDAEPSGTAEELDTGESDWMPEPVIPIDMLREAIAHNRVSFHIEPIVALPQRRSYGYDVVPRLLLDDDELAEAADFMPRQGGEDVVARLEADALAEAVTAIRRVSAGHVPLSLHVPLSRASLADPQAMAAIRAVLEADRGVAGGLRFTIEQSEFTALSLPERRALDSVGKLGIGFSLANASSLRCDYADLQGLGFRTVRVDATRFLRRPESFTDFHPADVAAYVGRFDIDLIATGVIDEQQLLALLEHGVALAQGPYIGAASPIRADLRLERDAPKRLAQLRL